jgi:hypothetical protein
MACRSSLVENSTRTTGTILYDGTNKPISITYHYLQFRYTVRVPYEYRSLFPGTLTGTSVAIILNWLPKNELRTYAFSASKYTVRLQ